MQIFICLFFSTFCVEDEKFVNIQEIFPHSVIRTQNNFLYIIIKV